MKKIFFVLLLTPMLFFQCKSSKNTTSPSISSKGEGVQFMQSNTLFSVLDEAEDKGKLVFMDIHASWCQPCKMMDRDVFPDKEISNFFNKNFINYKVDGEKGNGPNIVALYQVKAYPTLLWLDSKGNVVERTEGGTYHTELMKLAKNALSNSGM